MRNLIPHFIQDKFTKNERHGHFEGYTMFIDLSGFTALTQSLTKKGDAGAEQLSNILNRIFEPLVELVYSQGGFIPYFAGDSFIAVFPPPFSSIAVDRLIYTALRARVLYKEQSFLGSFKIGIKIGISSGNIEWGIVGEDKNSFYFRGDAIDRCAKSQLKANSEEIIIHEALKQQLPAHYHVDPIAIDYYVLTYKDLNFKLAAKDYPRTPLTRAVIERFIPNEILALNSDGEFRTVVSVFISFSGISTHKQLNRFANIVLDRVKNFSGYFKEIDFGDKGGVIPIFFGAPISFENSVDRALEFVLSVCEELKEAFGDQIQHRIGVTMGTAYTGFIGCSERCQYAAVGNCVNLAARLMTYADNGEILVDEDVQRSRQFKFKHKGNIRYKGFDGDLPTFILKRRNTENKFVFTGEMVGRSKEMAQLEQFTAPLLNGKVAGVAYIYGEAGIGKSRLAFEFRKNLFSKTPVNWFVCKADQILRKGMNPFIYFLSYYFEQSSENTSEQNKDNFEKEFQLLVNDIQKLQRPEAAELTQELYRTKTVLAGLLDISYHEDSLWEQLDAKGRFQNIKIALVSLFIAESLMRPVVIFLEDGHWFDDLSKTFLNEFLRYIIPYPIVLLVTSRYTDDQRKPLLIEKTAIEEYGLPILEIDLNFLSNETIPSFASKILYGEIHPEFLKLLVRTTNGNPFYLEQVLEYFKESNLLVEEQGKWTIKDKNIKLSNSINTILMARIDRLSHLVKETVKAAAVIGQEFDLPVLSEVMQEQESFIRRNGNFQHVLQEQVQQAEKGQIWRAINELRYLFKHSLLREAVYSMQLKTQVKHLHRLIAEAIEKLYADNIHQHYFDLAFHYEQAEAPEKTDYYLRRAADHARRNYQNNLALDYYTKLLGRIQEQTERVGVLQVRGQVLERLGRWESARSTYEEGLNLARQLNDKFLLGHANANYGKLLLLQGKYADARMHLEVAATFFEFIRNQDGMAKVYGSLGNLYFRQGQYEDAKAYLIQSIRLAKESPNITPDPQIVANLGLTYMNRGEYEEGIDWHHQGIEIVERTKDRLGMANLQTSLGILYFEKGDYDAALACYEKGLQLSKELGDKQIMAIAIGSIGRIYERKGDYEQAMAHYMDDLEICEELGDKQGKAIVMGLIGDLFSVKGEFDKAIQYIEKGLKISRELGYQKGIAKAVNTLGDVYYYKDNYEISIQCYEKAIEVTRNIDNKLVLGFSLTEKARTLLAANQLDKVPAVQQEAISIANDLGNPDLLFEVTILTAKMKARQQKREEAIQLIEELLSEDIDQGQSAAAYYALSKIDTTNSFYRQKALELYQVLYTETPQFAFKRRIDELNQ